MVNPRGNSREQFPYGIASLLKWALPRCELRMTAGGFLFSLVATKATTDLLIPERFFLR